jgi:hypothetical protein
MSPETLLRLAAFEHAAGGRLQQVSAAFARHEAAQRART